LKEAKEQVRDLEEENETLQEQLDHISDIVAPEPDDEEDEDDEEDPVQDPMAASSRCRRSRQIRVRHDAPSPNHAARMPVTPDGAALGSLGRISLHRRAAKPKQNP
jgi:hypothetical protein